MTTQIVLQGFIAFLHDFFTAAWLGGMLALAFAALPAARKTLGTAEELQHFAAALKSRMRVIALVSMAGLALTGILMARRATGGRIQPLDFSTPYRVVLAVKHFSMLVMVALALLRGFAKPGKKGLGAMKPQMILLAANIALGVAVLLASGLLSVLSPSD